MLRLPLLSATVLLTSLSPVLAAYDKFQFASNSTQHLCPGSVFACVPPSICSHDVFTDQYYCCIPGAEDAVCWKGSPACDGGSKGKPSGSQQQCSSGASAFCCLKDREECTQTSNQINICWSTSANPVANLSNAALNKTYSSLLSAKPSATAFPVSLSDLSPTPTPSSSASSASSANTASTASTATTSSATSTSSSTSPPSPTSQSSSNSGLSGGAIGGIVGGVVGGLALLGLIGFFLWRRRKAAGHKHTPIAPGSPSESANPYEMSAYQAAQPQMAEAPVTEKYAYRDHVPAGPGYAHEAHGESRPTHYEMDGSGPAEMDGSNPGVRR